MDKKSKPAKHRDLLTKLRPKWRLDVEEDDYINAFAYLNLLTGNEETAQIIVGRFRDRAGLEDHPARDLLRAAELPLLDCSDECVKRELVRIANGEKISPVLYIRGGNGRTPILVDGYYRLCAAYWCDPSGEAAAKIV